MYRRLLNATLVSTFALCGACSSSDDVAKSDAEFERDVVNGMHDSLLADIDELHAAALELQNAAPTPSGRGWSATEDAAAITAMKAAWKRTRTAYEHVEGALAPIFPDIDVSIDARYDDYMTELGGQGDAYAFDDQGVTGMHGVERILWSDSIPEGVVTFEASLPGYRVAAFPATEQEARDFRDELCTRIVSDAQTLHDQWTPQHIDVPGAYTGLIALMNEQREKVNKASTDEEESRYSQRTMVDIRDNLDGTTKIYALFQPWIVARKGGKDADARIQSGFAQLGTLYSAVSGEAIPVPPDTWSAESPSAADLATPFGKLYVGVQSAVDPASATSIVHAMNEAASLIGFTQFSASP